MKVLNTLNIDTAFGAVSFVFVASYLRNVEVEFAIYCTLFISVLFIYNLDHLVDAYRLKNKNSSARHAFYKTHFSILVLWQLLLLGAGSWLLLKLPMQVVFSGLLMTFFMGVYFLLIFKFSSKNYLLREVVVAIGYMLAILIVPFADKSLPNDLFFYGFSLIVFLVALTNLWVFALYDIELDENQDHHSIARRISVVKLTKLATLLICTTLSLLIAYAFYVNWVVGALLIIVELVYFLLLQNQTYFKNNDLYRSVGESILILPSLGLLIQYAI